MESKRPCDVLGSPIEIDLTLGNPMPVNCASAGVLRPCSWGGRLEFGDTKKGMPASEQPPTLGTTRGDGGYTSNDCRNRSLNEYVNI